MEAIAQQVRMGVRDLQSRSDLTILWKVYRFLLLYV